jgi:hypothetical protein
MFVIYSEKDQLYYQHHKTINYLHNLQLQQRQIINFGETVNQSTTSDGCIYCLTITRSYLALDGSTPSHRNDGTYLHSGLRGIIIQKATISTLIHHSETLKSCKC